MSALTDLLEKVEAGEAGSREFNRAFPTSLNDHFSSSVGAYSGSLDEAKVLHEAVLVGWYSRIDTEGKAYVSDYAKKQQVGFSNDNPARAWLIAILKALIAKETT